MIRSLQMERPPLLPVVAAGLACTMAGAMVAVRPASAWLVVMAVAYVLILPNWRRGLVALLLFLPFSGVPVFLAGTGGLLVRDIAIVVPLYLAFLLAMLASREAALPPLGIAIPALAAFALLVAGHVALAPSPMIGAIGAKVWLAYLPMIVIGYHFVREPEDAVTVLQVTALVALAPAALALAEWLVAARTGSIGPFLGLYGPIAERVDGRVVEFGSVAIPRVPSTFTSVSQYYSFAIVAFAASLSLALGRRQRIWALVAVVLAVAALASGARAAYLTVPAMAALALLLAGARPSRMVTLVIGAGGAMAVILYFGGDPIRIASEIPGLLSESLATAWREFRTGLSPSLVGKGTGWDTNAALRYGPALDATLRYDATGPERRYVENWFAKVVLELGPLGLLTMVVALLGLAYTLVGYVRRLEGTAKLTAAPICALLLVVGVSLIKAPYIDFEPLSVYFWLLIGVIAGLYRVSRAGAPAEAGVAIPSIAGERGSLR